MRVILFVCFLAISNFSISQKIEFSNPKDEFDITNGMMQLLIHLEFFIYETANKSLYVEKVENGIIYIDSAKYTKEEKDLINTEIDKWIVFTDSTRDIRSQDLTYNFGVDSDWDDRYPEDDIQAKSNEVPIKGYEIMPNQRNCEELEALQMRDLSLIIEEGNYVNNEKEGEWTTLNATEKIAQNYAKGKLNGAYIKYNNDILIERGQYLDGFKSGEWEKYTQDGKLISQSVFINDNLNGVFKKYNLRRTLDPGVFEGGDVISEEGFYLNGVMDGVWTYRYDDGRIKAKGVFKNGDGTGFSKESHGLPTSGREGVWLFYYYSTNQFYELTNLMNKEPGDPPMDYNETETQEKSNWINGSCEGKTTHSIAGKNRLEIDYLKGVRNGKFVVYFENGKKQLETIFANGTFEFEGNYLYRSGRKFEYKNGKWEEQLTPEERFARMQKQVEEMNEKADELAERIKNQADNSSQNSSYTKTMCNGHVMDRRYIDNAFRLEINLIVICPYCHDHIKRQWVTFTNGRKGDCDEREFECSDCGKICILKPCLIKTLEEGDKF